jgi:hypothetical protein
MIFYVVRTAFLHARYEASDKPTDEGWFFGEAIEENV